MPSNFLTGCSGGSGFYGISVAETDGSPSYPGIVKVNFNSSDFYINQNSPNTDEAIINLRGATGGGSGEANTASNLGAGEGVFSTKAGVDLQFKSLIAGTGITLTPTSTDITVASTGGGGGFYGIAVAETDGTGSYKNINTIKFHANDFYINQNSPNTDEAIINLRHRLTKINESSGTLNFSANFVPETANTFNLGSNTKRTDKIFARQVVAVSGNAAYPGGNVFGATTGSRSRIKAGLASALNGSFATGYAQDLGGAGVIGRSSIQAYGKGSFVSGNSIGLNNYRATIQADSDGATAHGFTYANFGSATISAGKGSFAFGHVTSNYGTNANVDSSGLGAWAGGYNFDSYITASGSGSFAFGSSKYGSITAAGNGAFAFGRTYSVNFQINASAAGSFAFGYAFGSSVEALATNSFQFGQGSNSISDSAQFGSTILLNGLTGEIDFDGPLNHDGTTVGLFGKTPVTQRADCFYLNVGASFNQTNINDNFAEVAAKVNRIRDALRKIGIMAGG